MVHILDKLGEWYYDYSTNTDCFTTGGMSLDELKEWYHGDDLEDRLHRVEKYGTSYFEPTKAVLYFEEAEGGDRG